METDCLRSSRASPPTTQWGHCESNVFNHVLSRVVSGDMKSRLRTGCQKRFRCGRFERDSDRKDDERHNRASTSQSTAVYCGSNTIEEALEADLEF